LRRRLRQRVSTVPFVPPHLTFKALGRVEVTVRGRVVTNKEWEAQVARDLLFCLLAHPNGLTNEQIGAIFWPDKSPARLNGQLKKTVYRLRRILGKDTVPLDQDLYRFNQAVDYEYDVTVFEEKLKQARMADDPAEKMVAYQAVLDLYAGPYLPDVDAEWANLERERLRQAFLTAVLALAQLYFDERQYESAIDYGQRILAEDPCHEQAHRLVMRAYAALDDLVAVTRQFERCQEILSEEVGMTVSPQTRALYKRLTHQ
jgi:DNA-binding SARP family transcriptional activator